MTNNPNSLYEIRPISSPGEASPNSIAIGNLNSVMEYIPQSRARQDAYEELEAARIKSEQTSIIQDMNRGIHAAVLCDAVTRLTRRLDAEEHRRTEKARRDAEEREAAENKLIEDTLSALPDPDMPTLATADTPGEPKDLHTGPSVLAQDNRAAHGSRAERDNEGDLPNELLEKTPPPPGTDPDLSGSKQPSARNPASFDW
jgi:hypothetical protein